MGRTNSVAILLGISVLLCYCDYSLTAVLYRNHTLKEWCDPNPLFKIVRKLITHQNDMFLTRENPLQITHRWESTYEDECVFTVEAEYGAGLVMNVNQMYFRENDHDPLSECIDYLRLKFPNGTKTGKMCGLVNATTITSHTMSKRSFIVPQGRVEVKIRLDDIRRLKGPEYLYVDFLFTQYNSCGLANSFQCAEGLCIHQKYMHDGNINCPYPNCLDEVSCQNKTIIIPQVGNSKRAIISEIALAVVLAVLVPITICCCCEFCRKGAVSRGRPPRSGPTSRGNPQENRSSSSGGGRRHRHRTNRGASRGHRSADQARGDQSAAARPQTVGFTAVYTPSPPPEEEKESPPPTYESLFPER